MNWDPGYWVLEGHTPVRVDTVLEWGRWMETADRRVARTTVEGYEVSTVFLGLDQQFFNGPPLLFETMVFAEGHADMDMDMWRYSTWDQALAGHDQVVADIRAKESKRG